MVTTSKWLAANLIENGNSWSNLSKSEKIAIRDFPVLWAMFESRILDDRGRPNASPVYISNAVRDLGEFDLGGKVRDASRYFHNRYSQNNFINVHWDGLSVMGENNQMAVKDGLGAEDNNPRACLLAVLLVINRLRNNFLHGAKARYAFSGQYENFKHANNTLMDTIPFWRD
jgi:hypothetical protein